MSVCMHIFVHTIGALHRARKPTAAPIHVGDESINRALLLLNYAQSQKDIVINVNKIML